MDTNEILEAMLYVGWRIERCGASPELTDAVTLNSDLRAAIRGDEWAVKRVREQIELDKCRRFGLSYPARPDGEGGAG